MPLLRQDDLTAAGDVMQSAGSRIAEWICEHGSKMLGRNLPYEVYMAALELRDASDDWTAARTVPRCPECDRRDRAAPCSTCNPVAV